MNKHIKALELELMSAHARAECNPTREEYNAAWDDIERLTAAIEVAKAEAAVAC